jgi:ribonuclease HI
VDYGLLAYGNASKTNIEKLNIICRAPIRTILGSKQSTPTQILYAETGTEPIADKRNWLTGKYIIKLGHKHQNPTYKSAQAIFSAPANYPPRSSPCLAAQMAEIHQLGIDAFPTSLQWPPIYRYPPPNLPPPLAMANKTQTRTLFESLLLLQPNTTLIGYTDGSKSTDSNITSCAVVIPDLDLEKAWTLETHSSVFSAELQAIKLALKIIYDLDPSPASTIIFSDSSSAIKAIIASNPSSNEVIPEIRELLHSLKSSGTQTTLAWILSHTGIEGNERADYLAGIQCTETPT